MSQRKKVQGIAAASFSAVGFISLVHRLKKKKMQTASVAMSIFSFLPPSSEVKISLDKSSKRLKCYQINET